MFYVSLDGVVLVRGHDVVVGDVFALEDEDAPTDDEPVDELDGAQKGKTHAKTHQSTHIS